MHAIHAIQRSVMSLFVRGACTVLAALASTGCYARAYTATEPAYVEARYVPAHVETYPSDYYDGRVVYLVDGRWYYRDGSRWAYYRREPAPLYRRRVYVQQAPAAPERRYRTYSAPAPARPDRDRRRDHRDNDDGKRDHDDRDRGERRVPAPRNR